MIEVFKTRAFVIFLVILAGCSKADSNSGKAERESQYGKYFLQWFPDDTDGNG